MKPLGRKLCKHRAVITHKEAPAYVNYEVSSGRIKDDTKGRKLLADTPDTLPARRMGNLHFVHTDELFRWQIEEDVNGGAYRYNSPRHW